MTSKKLGTGFVVLLAALIAGAYLPQVQGEDDDGVVTKPFKISGGGTLDMLPLAPGSQGNHTAVGTATGVGKYHLSEAAAQLDGFIDPLTANFSSAIDPVFVAANGDELVLHYEGIVTLTPVLDENNQPTGEFTSRWVAEFTPVTDKCTGRFLKVVGGSFEMIATTGAFALTDTDIPYTWEGDGTLDWIEED